MRACSIRLVHHTDNGYTSQLSDNFSHFRYVYWAFIGFCLTVDYTLRVRLGAEC